MKYDDVDVRLGFRFDPSKAKPPHHSTSSSVVFERVLVPRNRLFLVSLDGDFDGDDLFAFFFNRSFSVTPSTKFLQKKATSKGVKTWPPRVCWDGGRILQFTSLTAQNTSPDTEERD